MREQKQRTNGKRPAHPSERTEPFDPDGNATNKVNATSPTARKDEPPPRAKLLSLVEQSGTKVFSSSEGEVWATRKGLTHRLKSKDFKAWLVNEAFNRHGDFCSADALEVVLGLLESRARMKSATRQVFVRIGMDAKGLLWLDLGKRKSGAAVKLTPEGWSIRKRPGVHFHRARGTQELPEPRHGAPLNTMRQLLNLQGDRDWVLAVVWCLAAMRPDIPQPILVLQGEQGSAKTTTARLLRRLIDPAKPETRSMPKKEDDLLVAARGRWVLSFDNLSGLAPSPSDALCRLSTGGGIGKRELYTDGDECLLDARRPVILNGIDDLLSRGDLASRAIVLELPTIPEERRRTEAEVLSQFDDLHAELLGALCDCVCEALRCEADARSRLKRLPRLADAVVWASAAEESLGWSEGTVEEGVEKLAEEVASDALERDEVAASLLKFMDGRIRWEGTPSTLKKTLEEVYGSNLPADWPRTARGLANALKRAAPVLRRQGIVWSGSDAGRSGKARRWTVTTVTTVTGDGNNVGQGDGRDGCDGRGVDSGGRP